MKEVFSFPRDRNWYDKLDEQMGDTKYQEDKWEGGPKLP